MAKHGYAREYDEGWNRDDERENSWRDRDERDREWRGTEHNRGFMIGDAWAGNHDWPQQDRSSAGYGREQGFGTQGDWQGQRSNYSANLDDHYRSWRDKQMQALDRDYQDYCREREQQFQNDFDTWRNQRHSNREPLQTGMTQTGPSADPSGVTQLNQNVDQPTTGIDPIGEATAGTNSSNPTTTGRGRR